jgi:hypothetical protein
MQLIFAFLVTAGLGLLALYFVLYYLQSNKHIKFLRSLQCGDKVKCGREELYYFSRTGKHAIVYQFHSGQITYKTVPYHLLESLNI